MYVDFTPPVQSALRRRRVLRGVRSVAHIKSLFAGGQQVIGVQALHVSRHLHEPSLRVGQSVRMSYCAGVRMSGGWQLVLGIS